MDLARASHTRQAHAPGTGHLAPGSAGSGGEERHPSLQSLRKAASTAVQGLRGAFFRHGSFLELVTPACSERGSGVMGVPRQQ